ncbi:MAG: hypothetical protein R3C12_19400 [Planctomycetaceae bacterium]
MKTRHDIRLSLSSVMHSLFSHRPWKKRRQYPTEKVASTSPGQAFETWLSRRTEAVPAHSHLFRPLRVLALEDRRVLSVTAMVVLDSLMITGTDADDTVKVEVSGTTLQLLDAGNDVIKIDSNPSLDISGLTSISFDLGDGDDVIDMSSIEGISLVVQEDMTGNDSVTLTGISGVTFSALEISGETIYLSGEVNSSTVVELTGSIILTADTHLFAGQTSFIDGSITGQNSDETLTISSTAADVDWNFTGTVDSLDTLTIESARHVQFDDAITVSGTFEQLSGTGTTTLDGSVAAESVNLSTSALEINQNITLSTGLLELTTDSLAIAETATITADAGVGIQTATDSRGIELGGTTETAGTLSLTEAEILTISSIGTVTIGSSGYTGQLNFSALDLSGSGFSLTILAGTGAEISILETLTLGENNFLIDPPTDVVVAAPILATGLATVFLEATNNITFTTDGIIQTEQGSITLLSGNNISFEQTTTTVLTTATGEILITADADNNNTGSVLIDADVVISTSAGTGNITMTGPITSSTADTFKATFTAGDGIIQFTDTIDDLAELTVTAATTTRFEGGRRPAGGLTVASTTTLPRPAAPPWRPPNTGAVVLEADLELTASGARL